MPRAERQHRPPLADHYIQWLENELTTESKFPERTYYELVNLMLQTEFAYSIDMDDNRLADGIELRTEFADMFHIPRARMRGFGKCSFIEVLLGLSRRLAFVAGGTPGRWAWQLLVNLGLDRMWDHLSRSKTRVASDILGVVIDRNYQPNGIGGFFPLAWPDRDQTQIELWYQLNAYAEELHPEH